MMNVVEANQLIFNHAKSTWMSGVLNMEAIWAEEFPHLLADLQHHRKSNINFDSYRSTSNLHRIELLKKCGYPYFDLDDNQVQTLTRAAINKIIPDQPFTYSRIFKIIFFQNEHDRMLVRMAV